MATCRRQSPRLSLAGNPLGVSGGGETPWKSIRGRRLTMRTLIFPHASNTLLDAVHLPDLVAADSGDSWRADECHGVSGQGKLEHKRRGKRRCTQPGICDREGTRSCLSPSTTVPSFNNTLHDDNEVVQNSLPHQPRLHLATTHDTIHCRMRRFASLDTTTITERR